MKRESNWQSGVEKDADVERNIFLPYCKYSGK